MLIHEYQAKELFREYGIPVAPGAVAFNPDGARNAALTLDAFPVMVKAQVHAGGRGKAGGILSSQNAGDAAAAAEKLLGTTLVTKQTGPEGKPVSAVYIEGMTAPKHEYYLSALVDASEGCVVIVASGEGGMDIEEVAERSPGSIVKLPVDPMLGLKAYQAYNIAAAIGIPAAYMRQFADILDSLYTLFCRRDCSLVEINPLALTERGLIALDAKIELDSSADFRHRQNAAMRDRSQEHPLEALAADSGLGYVVLDGDIGCLVIGAGLAMSTMDAVQYFGAKPANFMDCGAKTSAADSKLAFGIVMDGSGVEGILVNIFGGITRTNLIAQGIIECVRERKPQVPVVVRLEGTGSEEANDMIRSSGLPIHLASSLSEGTQLVIALAAERRRAQ